MDFLQEINEMLGTKNIGTDLYVCFMPSTGAVVQGYKKLIEISDTRLVVLGKNKRKIEIVGNGLEIYSLAPAEIVVHGKVNSVGEVNE